MSVIAQALPRCRSKALWSQPLTRCFVSNKTALTGPPSCKGTFPVKARRLLTLRCASKAQQGPDISLLSPFLQRQWHNDKNAHLGTIVIRPHSNRKVWWTCDQCPDGHPHEWLASLNDRSNGTRCPFCRNKDVCQHNSLATKDRAVAAQWSHKNQLTPEDFLVSSSKKQLWQCECGFEWEAAIKQRTGRRPTGCPACATARNRQPKPRHPVLTDSEHETMQSWDWETNAKAGLDPSKLTCGSGIEAHWICHECPRGQPHRWQAVVGNIYRCTGSGCPYCKGLQACVCNSLQSLWPDKAAEWDYSRNKGTPADYSAQSHCKAWWHTAERSSFQARICDHTYVRKQHPPDKQPK